MNESSDLSVFKVYFSQTDSILYKTDVLYSWYDIVSEYGGLLSLFLGCSIISIFEIFFFVTVRFYQNLFNSTSFMNIFEKKKPIVFGNKAFHRANFEYVH
jgi:Amiloride-sensitive sodium channel